MADDDGVAPMEVEGADGEFAEAQPRRRRSAKPEPAPAADQPGDDRAEGEAEAEDALQEHDGGGTGTGDQAAAEEEEASEGEHEREESTDRERAKELKKKQKTRQDLKLFNEALDRPEMVPMFLKQNQDGLFKAATKLDHISKSIGKKDVSNSLLDATGFSKLGTFGQRQAQQLASTTKIDIDEMVSKLQARFVRAGGDDEDGGHGTIDWHAFGDATTHLWRRVFVTSFMKGLLGLQATVKEKKAAKRRAAKMDDDEPVAHAEQLRDTSKEAESMTDKRVVLLFHHLPQEPTSFFDVLIHPTSFTQTVENIFDLTFLVKKGQAEIALDPELGIPTVRRMGDQDDVIPDEEDEAAGTQGDGARRGAATNFQCIMKLDLETWERIVKAFGLTGRKPFLPDRTRAYEQSDKWGDHAAPSAAPASATKRGAAKRGRASEKITAAEKIGAHFTPSQPTLLEHMSSNPPRAAAQRARKKARHNDSSEDEDQQDVSSAYSHQGSEEE